MQSMIQHYQGSNSGEVGINLYGVGYNQLRKMNTMKRPSLAWTLFLIFLFTTQIDDSQALTSLKLKKLLKKFLLLKALSPKKGIAIIPIPIPLSLLAKLKLDAMKDEMPMPEMPMPMPMMPSYPMPMPMPMGDMMMGYPMTMPMSKEKEMSGSKKYGMM